MKNQKKILIENLSLPLEIKKKNLQQIIAGSHILKSKVVCKNNENDKQSGKYAACVSRLNNLFCKQVKQTNIFKSYRTNQVFKMILHVKVKISHIYSNVEYVNFNRLEKGKLLLTSV